MHTGATWRGLALTAVVLVCAAGLPVSAAEPKEPPARIPIREVPETFRGTIGAEATIRGVEPTLVSGLGVVTGLKGTGGGELDAAVMATMEREVAKNGIGRGAAGAVGALEGVTPQQFLRDPSVAVVIVEAAIAPGSPEGEAFDVYVRALPGSGVTSLEGGTLWTTDLRLGQATTFGGFKTRRIAEARGPVFINPFAEPGAEGTGQAAVMRTAGRVLGGGRVTAPLQMELSLDNASHARARSVVGAINSRFPRGARDDGPTARGRGGAKHDGIAIRPEKDLEAPVGSQSIALRVPYEYRERAADFLQLVRFMRIDTAFPEEWAKRYVDALKASPEYATEIGWCLKALGKTSVPFLAPMYEYPELAPRMAALEAGAFLGDPRVVGPLVELAKAGPTLIRTRSIELLGEMPANPVINLALRELVGVSELDVRVAAYEGLVKRHDPAITRRAIGPDPTRPKFVLDVAPIGEPLIYVTQQGMPRVAILGARESVTGEPGGTAKKRTGLMVTRPVLVTAWQDRFMMTGEEGTSDLRVMYRDGRGEQAITTTAPSQVGDLIAMLAQKQTPEDPRPGLDLSYSEIVGLLYEMSKGGAVAAGFTTEEDRLRASIYEASRSLALTDRPETDDASRGPRDVFEPQRPPSVGAVGEGDGGKGKGPRVIPITPGPGKEKKPE